MHTLCPAVFERREHAGTRGGLCHRGVGGSTCRGRAQQRRQEAAACTGGAHKLALQICSLPLHLRRCLPAAAAAAAEAGWQETTGIQGGGAHSTDRCAGRHHHRTQVRGSRTGCPQGMQTSAQLILADRQLPPQAVPTVGHSNCVLPCTPCSWERASARSEHEAEARSRSSAGAQRSLRRSSSTRRVQQRQQRRRLPRAARRRQQRI